MKKVKILGVICLFSCCFLLSGCGKGKVLTCSINQEQAGLSMDQSVQFTFNGNKVSNLKLTVASKAVNDSIKSQWDTFAESLDSQFPDSNLQGIKLTKENKEKDYTYTITIDVDVAKADDKDLAKYDLDGLADLEGTYDSVKKEAKKSGFTCE